MERSIGRMDQIEACSPGLSARALAATIEKAPDQVVSDRVQPLA